MDQRPKYESYSYKLWEENIGIPLNDLGLGGDFLDITSKAQMIKLKNWLVGLHQN